jgi:hypothetical protein
MMLLSFTSNATSESKYAFSVSGDSSLRVCSSLAAANFRTPKEAIQ